MNVWAFGSIWKVMLQAVYTKRVFVMTFEEGINKKMRIIPPKIVCTITAVADTSMSITSFAANNGSEPFYLSTSLAALSAPSNEVEECYHKC